MASETTPGPARRLVEDAFDPAVDAYIYGGIHDHLRADEASKRMDALLAAADQHDAHDARLEIAYRHALESAQTFRELLAEERQRIAALVQAAEAFFVWFDNVDSTTAQGVQARNQLRAALKAAREATKGKSHD